MTDDADIAVLKAQHQMIEQSLQKMSQQIAALEKATIIMDVNNREFPDIKDRIRNLEEKENKRTGALAIVFIMGGLLSAVMSNIKHFTALIGGDHH